MSRLKPCFLTKNDVITDIFTTKSGKSSVVCYQAADCEKRSLCVCLRKIPAEKIKLKFIKCCGVCDNASFCGYRKRGFK